MATIPEAFNKINWLFAEDEEAKGTYEFDKLIPEYETRKGNKIPVFLLLGRQGDVVVSIWNVENLNELRKHLGDDDAKWHNRLFDIKPNADKTKLIFMPL